MSFCFSNIINHTAMGLIMGLLMACGKPEAESQRAADEVGAPSEEQLAMENPPENAMPAVPEGRMRLGDPEDLPVLAEMNGLYYQAFEIAERPYNGKRMEYHPGGIEKKETLFVDGALSRITEWDEGGQKRSEVNVSPTGVRREQYWDATGKPIAKPAAPQGPLGRTMNWTFGAGRTSIEFVYRGKSSDIIRKAFGEPDEELNGVWIYRGMKVQAAQQLMTTVRFVMQNDTVLQVSVEP
jgi:hypothetical protein